MASFQDVLDGVAKVIGGTAPSTATPRWFSGQQTADSTGIMSPIAINGCYSTVPPGSLSADPPYGFIVLDHFSVPQLLHQGGEMTEDFVRLVIIVPANDPETQVANLMGFRDAVPTALQGHMTAFAALNVMDVYPTTGKFGQYHTPGGAIFPSVEFMLRIRRYAAATYTP